MYSISSGLPLRWRKRPQRPPVPFVEDEIDSLSRELDGLFHIGELPGLEGAKARGTVNQSALIEDVELPNALKNSSNVEEKTSTGSRSSGFYADQSTKDARGPKQTPSRQPAGDSSQEPGKPSQRIQPKPLDVPASQGLKPVHVSEPQKSPTCVSQKPIPHQQEPACQVTCEVPAQKLPAKKIPEVAQKRQMAPSHSSSLHRGSEPHRADLPSRFTHPELARNGGIRTSFPAKPLPDASERNQSVPSRATSLRRAQKQHNESSSPTRFVQPESVQSGVRTSSPSKRLSNVAQQSQPVLSRTPFVRRDNDERRFASTTMTRAEPAGVPKVPAGSLPPKVPVAQEPQVISPRPLPVPQESQNRAPHFGPHQPAPARETSVRGPAPPPKQMHDTTRQSQSTVPRPVPTPPDDEQRKPRPSSVAYEAKIVVRDSGVRVETIPPRSLAEVPPKTQRPLSENVHYKSFATSITPPPDTPPTTTATGLQSFPSRGAPLHPLPNPPAERPHSPPSSTMKESASVKQATSTRRSPAEPLSSTSGHVPPALSRSPNLPVERDTPSPSGPSVAERLEEKLKLRREQRDVPHIALAQSNSPERKAPPGAWPSDLRSESSSSSLTEFPALEQSSVETRQHTKTTPLKSAMRSQSLDRSQPASTKVARRRTVAFAENPLEHPSQALVKVDRETALTRVQSREDGPAHSSRSSSPNTGLTLAPCPRSIPVAGYQDWHTIEGLPHLDICPFCIKQMRKSKFRDRLVLSAPKPREEPVRCSMSEPWTRLAWVQTLKKKYETLDLLLEITRPSNTQGTKSCTGRIINEQHWYRIIDPETGLYLPQFNVCSACVRNIRLLMPAHRDTFQRSTTPQERVCDFVTDSPRFIRYIDALDLASNRAEQDDAPPDLKEFLSYARRKVVLRDCRRSRLIFNTWHYMPQLPEFTVCEDCYDDIRYRVWNPRGELSIIFAANSG
ncbi:uncharacterized protein BDW70DRAFT_149876 [Aspergillus foveolatus]|uniref:uncharacterized protein n=1 Tax=Aspergillus foveolatus TaxID=210207 RepID=UPI003CCD9061